MEERKMYAGFCLESLKEKENCENPPINGRTILK
jgi:hypothetical protein